MTALNDRFSLVPIEALYDELLTNAEFRMLTVLYSFRDKNCNTVWPRLKILAERAGYSDNTQVSRMTSKLEKKGWLTKGKKRGPRGPKIYELTVPDRVQLVRKSQVDRGGQVDNSEHQKHGQHGQVDCSGQVDNLEHVPEANLTATVNSQLDRGSQLSYEHTSINIPIDHQSSDSCESASLLAKPVDNSFKAIGNDYQSASVEKLIFDRGIYFLSLYGIGPESARNFIGMCKRDYGVGRTLDAVIVSTLSQPVTDPKAFILGVLANQPRPIEASWQPEATQVGELEGLGVPMELIRNARDVFVTWFHEQEIDHSDWPRLFKDWVIRDWEAAEFQAHLYRARLAESAGLNYQRPFQEAP